MAAIAPVAVGVDDAPDIFRNDQRRNLPVAGLLDHAGGFSQTGRDRDHACLMKDGRLIFSGRRCISGFFPADQEFRGSAGPEQCCSKPGCGSMVKHHPWLFLTLPFKAILIRSIEVIVPVFVQCSFQFGQRDGRHKFDPVHLRTLTAEGPRDL